MSIWTASANRRDGARPQSEVTQSSELIRRLRVAKARALLELDRSALTGEATALTTPFDSGVEADRARGNRHRLPVHRPRAALAALVVGALLVGGLPAVAVAVSPAIVSGTLRNAAGTATPGSILLFNVDRRSDGRTALIDAMNTSTGSFTLRVDNNAYMQSAGADNSGYINMMLVGVNSQGSGVHFFSRRYASGSWIGRYGTSSVTLKTTLAHSGTDSQAFGDLWDRLNTVIIPPPPVNHVCGYNVLAAQIQPAMVGELFVSDNTNGIFTYGAGLKTDTEFGVKVSDDNNVFSAKGTTQIAVEGKQEVTVKRGFKSVVKGTYAKGVMSNFTFERQQKGAPVWDLWCWFSPNFRIVATDWNRGTLEGWNMPGFLNICDEMPADSREPYLPGSAWKRSTNQAITFGGGASAFGLSFDTKSGFSTSVTLEFETGAKYRTYWFCGDTNGGEPGWSSLRVFSGPNDL